MIRMTCEDCRTVYYSAAARTLVEQGQRCAKCGGRLVIDEPSTGSAKPVRAGSANGPDGDPEPTA
jgi:rRNA maturation endonuclease Nob1